MEFKTEKVWVGGSSCTGTVIVAKYIAVTREQAKEIILLYLKKHGYTNIELEDVFVVENEVVVDLKG